MLLKMVADDGHLIGVMNWFAVHGTSMNNTNTYISGDNKGFLNIIIEINNHSQVTLPIYSRERLTRVWSLARVRLLLHLAVQISVMCPLILKERR